MEKVSICLLTYMHEKYIDDALQGILSQTYQNIELIILDDNSADGTVEIIKSRLSELNSRFDTVKLIAHEKNTGNIPRNCNEMLKNATGSLIKLVAGDDIVLPNCVEELVQQMEIHRDAMVVHANGFVEKDSFQYGDAFSWRLFQEYELKYKKENLFRHLIYHNRILAPATLIRKEVYDKYGFYDENVGYEDYDLWLRLAANGELFYYYHKPLVVYRRTEGSVTDLTQGDVEKKLKYTLEAEVAIKSKYMHFLSEGEQRKVWQCIYSEWKERCVGMQFMEQLFADKKVEEKSSFKSSEVTIDKLQKGAAVLSCWVAGAEYINNYILEIKNEGKKVAVYGYARLGQRLYTELKRMGVEVPCIIDQRGAAVWTPENVFTLDDEIPNVDIIFVTILDGFDVVSKQLRNRFDADVVCLVEKIYELGTDY